MTPCPAYLSEYEELWKKEPHAANKAWFARARFGLFIHYGLYSQRGRGEWTLLHDKVPLKKYEKLADSFNPSGFDADAIVDLACEAGMSYINMVTCHHDGFCLWDSKTEPFNSQTYAGRDLVRELGEACDRRGLGFFTYFTHILNWRHPYAMKNGKFPYFRPDYRFTEPRYLLEDSGQWAQYWKWAHSCLQEICAFPFPIAGVWLDIAGAYYAEPGKIPIERTYEIIRHNRPEALISFKQGATGTEDFAAPEFHLRSQGIDLRKQGDLHGAEIADAAWEMNQHKHNEICMTLQKKGWGYRRGTRHIPSSQILRYLAYAEKNGCNLLANVGPLPDGSIHPADIRNLRKTGRIIREKGWPVSS